MVIPEEHFDFVRKKYDFSENECEKALDFVVDLLNNELRECRRVCPSAVNAIERLEIAQHEIRSINSDISAGIFNEA